MSLEELARFALCHSLVQALQSRVDCGVFYYLRHKNVKVVQYRSMKDYTPSGAFIPSGWGVWLFRAEIKQARPRSGNASIEYCVNKYSPTVLC